MRKDWYAHTVIFHLKRPQPSLRMMLASAYSPVYPAHVPVAEFRSRCVGTGPFKLKEWRKSESIELTRNPDYWAPGRPYLDGIKYVIIQERGPRFAALQSGRLDISFPAEATKAIADQLKASGAKLVFHQVAGNNNDNLLMNIKRAPFDNVTVRRAISHAMDRRAYIKTVTQGGAVPGPSVLPKPYGFWGLVERDLATLPGYGKPDENKALARKLLAEAGYNAQNLLRVEMATRAMMKMIDAQSQELNVQKRAALVAQIQRKLEEDAARPVMGWRLDYFPMAPYVKNLVPHNNLYNYGRMQDVWLDR